LNEEDPLWTGDCSSSLTVYLETRSSGSKRIRRGILEFI
jgi:hypothetical protein